MIPCNTMAVLVLFLCQRFWQWPLIIVPFGGWRAGSGPNGGWRNWRVAQMNNEMEQTSRQAVRHSSWSLVKPSLAWGSLVKVQPCSSEIRYLRFGLDLSSPLAPLSIASFAGPGPAQACKMWHEAVYLHTCIDRISRSMTSSYTDNILLHIVLHLITPDSHKVPGCWCASWLVPRSLCYFGGPFTGWTVQSLWRLRWRPGKHLHNLTHVHANCSRYLTYHDNEMERPNYMRVFLQTNDWRQVHAGTIIVWVLTSCPALPGHQHLKLKCHGCRTGFFQLSRV